MNPFYLWALFYMAMVRAPTSKPAGSNFQCRQIKSRLDELEDLEDAIAALKRKMGIAITDAPSIVPEVIELGDVQKLDELERRRGELAEQLEARGVYV